MRKYIVITGGPVCGLEFHGTFYTLTEANAWGKSNCDKSGYNIYELQSIKSIPTRQEMIKQLVQYEATNMTPAYMEEIFKEGFVGFTNDSDEQLIHAMKERGLL
jgi:hypothetical protein